MDKENDLKDFLTKINKTTNMLFILGILFALTSTVMYESELIKVPVDNIASACSAISVIFVSTGLILNNTVVQKLSKMNKNTVSIEKQDK